eukprot:gene6645-biopygen1394
MGGVYGMDGVCGMGGVGVMCDVCWVCGLYGVHNMYHIHVVYIGRGGGGGTPPSLRSGRPGRPAGQRAQPAGPVGLADLAHGTPCTLDHDLTARLRVGLQRVERCTNWFLQGNGVWLSNSPHSALVEADAAGEGADPVTKTSLRCPFVSHSCQGAANPAPRRVPSCCSAQSHSRRLAAGREALRAALLVWQKEDTDGKCTAPRSGPDSSQERDTLARDDRPPPQVTSTTLL